MILFYCENQLTKSWWAIDERNWLKLPFLLVWWWNASLIFWPANGGPERRISPKCLLFRCEAFFIVCPRCIFYFLFFWVVTWWWRWWYVIWCEYIASVTQYTSKAWLFWWSASCWLTILGRPYDKDYWEIDLNSNTKYWVISWSTCFVPPKSCPSLGFALLVPFLAHRCDAGHHLLQTVWW